MEQNEALIAALAFASVIIPISTGIVEIVKQTIKLPNTILPLISVLSGLVIGAAAYPFTDLDFILRLWAGAFAGMAGTGLFEILKKRPGETK